MFTLVPAGRDTFATTPSPILRRPSTVWSGRTWGTAGARHSVRCPTGRRPLFHSVLDSMLMFTALITRQAPFGYLDWVTAPAWAVLGNLVGGVGLVTLLRLARVLHRLAEERGHRS
jgi:hypothetical protein